MREDREHPRPTAPRGIRDEPELAALDRELRGIEFRERASFEAELRASLRRAGRPRKRSHIPAAVGVTLALLLASTQLTDGRRGGRPAGAEAAPVFIVEGSPAAAGLYLAVAADGRVLRVGPGHFPLTRTKSRNAGGGDTFACLFDIQEARCGPGAAVVGRAGSRLAGGPFVYRDLCCDVEERGRREGVLTISAMREPALFVFVYEDANGDGRLSTGDRLRARVHPSESEPDEALYANGSRPGPGDTRHARSESRSMAAVVYPF